MARKPNSRSTDPKPGLWAAYKAKMAAGDPLMWSLTTVSLLFLLAVLAA